MSPDTDRQGPFGPPQLSVAKAILCGAGLSPVLRVLALPIVVAAVLLYAIPNLWSRFRDSKRKEAMRMNGNAAKGVVLRASAFVGSGFLTNVAAAAVPG